MPEVLVNKWKLIGTGYTEMYGNGRRWRFYVERYVDDRGQEWGNILSMEEMPDEGALLIIPSLGLEAAELEHLQAEYAYEQSHPDDQELVWREYRKERKAHLAEWYVDACDQRRAEAHGNQRQFLTR